MRTKKGEIRSTKAIKLDKVMLKIYCQLAIVGFETAKLVTMQSLRKSSK